MRLSGEVGGSKKAARERYNAMRGHAVKARAKEIIRMMLNGGGEQRRFERAVVKSKEVFEASVRLGEVVGKDQIMILKIFQAIHSSIKRGDKLIKVILPKYI